MAPFFPVYIARSDGKLEITTKSGKKELNQPTDDQLDSSPDKRGVSDFYKKLEDGDAKEVDWRRKLGGMLMRELGGKEHQGLRLVEPSLKPRIVLTYLQARTTFWQIYRRTTSSTST